MNMLAEEFKIRGLRSSVYDLTVQYFVRGNKTKIYE